MSTQSVNVARFARNVEWDFFCDFQTPCFSAYRILKRKLEKIFLPIQFGFSFVKRLVMHAKLSHIFVLFFFSTVTEIESKKKCTSRLQEAWTKLGLGKWNFRNSTCKEKSLIGRWRLVIKWTFWTKFDLNRFKWTKMNCKVPKIH